LGRGIHRCSDSPESRCCILFLPTDPGLQVTSSLPRHPTDNLLQPCHPPALRSTETLQGAISAAFHTLYHSQTSVRVPCLCRRISAACPPPPESNQAPRVNSAHHPAYLASAPRICRQGRDLLEQDVNKVSSAFPAFVLLHVNLLYCVPHSCSWVTTHVFAMYTFHQEQHFYALKLAQRQELKSTDSWVMTSPNETGFVKLPNERILFTSPPRIHLQISTPNTYPGTEPFSAKSDAGVAYITNQRVRKRSRAYVL
jgi:hypothetical protein